MLSTPTPARPITFNRFPEAFRTSEVNFVAAYDNGVKLLKCPAEERSFVNGTQNNFMTRFFGSLATARLSIPSVTAILAMVGFGGGGVRTLGCAKI